ncbi:hypothetical protein PIB30_020080 [Stylosanthes scabra]|uniref:AP2/ERF domain-containing protein n=1 Tax=Stylosanthes scabra TaxID=79078 RepID=A0ABU6VAS7_9FABA|nr:hypothetical protein [Stylosanthes scabra]
MRSPPSSSSSSLLTYYITTLHTLPPSIPHPNHHTIKIENLHSIENPYTQTHTHMSNNITASPNDVSTLNNSKDSSNCKIYKGVRKRKWGKWVSEIRLPNSRERIWLGSYDTQEKAARAFDAALYCLRGRHASFNFPDTPLKLEINNNVSHYHSLSHQEIQEVASKFANNIDASNNENNANANEEEEEEPSSMVSSQNGSNSGYDYDGNNNNSNGNKNVQVDQGDIDWTFLNVLDDQNDSNFDNTIGYDFGPYYGGIDKVHSDEFLYTTTPPTIYQDNNGDGDDAFSNHSFLWSWNF